VPLVGQVYRTERATLIQGDCLDVMKSLADGSVDAVITDPPYNLGIKYASTDDTRDDYLDWCSSWLKECFRVSCGAVAISCGIANLGMWHHISKPCWVVCWWKPASMGRCTVGFNNWEPVLLYGKSKGRKGCDVVRATIRPDDSLKGHPCPKPLEWAVGLINLLTKSDMVVLDPFVGSGTTGVACIQTGRNFIGIEISEEYCGIAKERLAKAELACVKQKET
jgi:site-specific DNA-methyltransferase (adenine-specific)